MAAPLQEYLGNIEESEIGYGRLIGQGSFAKVYDGVWRNKKVAVKIVNADNVLAANEAQKEAEMMALVDHLL